MASKRHLDNVWAEVKKTPPFRRIVFVIAQEPTEDGKNAIIKYIRSLLNEELNAARTSRENPA